MSSSIETATARQSVWQLRRDLEFFWNDGLSGGEGYWVVKDPYSNEWYCITPVELRLLKLADGLRSLPELCRQAVSEIAPTVSTVDSMATFYTQARSIGFLKSKSAAGDIDRAVVRSRVSVKGRGRQPLLSKVVAFRLPGIHPNRLPALPRWAVHAFRSPTAWMGYVALVIATVLIFVGRFDVFLREVAVAFARTDATWLLACLLTLAGCKTIHELSHLMACQSVGAECRELGIMLFFGVPCLYCDVSDVWVVSNRYQRVLVSSAGMLGEVFLASAATFVWFFTSPSMVHDLSLLVMVVCSISTLLINANPLLRYDGYFILADLQHAPNLAKNAFDCLRQTMRRLLWGSCIEPYESRVVGNYLGQSKLLTYAAASLSYRSVIVALIALAIYHKSVDLGFGWLGLAFGLLLLGAMSVRVIGSVSSPPRDSDQAWYCRRRPWIILAAGLALVIGIINLPLRSKIVIPVYVTPHPESEIRVLESGRLVEILPSGSPVAAGQPLLHLVNPDLSDELQRARGENAESRAVVEAWQRRRGDQSGSPSALAVANQRLRNTQKNVERLEDRNDRLTVRSALSGDFQHEQGERKHLAGSIAKESISVGQWVPAGTPLGWIETSRKRLGLGSVPESSIDLIKPGQDVAIRHASLPKESIRGVVRQVDAVEWERLPAELVAEIEGIGGSSNGTALKYLAQIELSSTETCTLPIGAVVNAEVTVERRSVWNRLRRLFSLEFRGL